MFNLSNSRIYNTIENRWLSIIGLLCIVSFGRVILSYTIGRKNLFTISGADELFYEHAGWYMTKGAIPYVSFWDPKPPANFEVSYLIALFSMDNPYILHLLHVLILVTISIGIVYLSAKIVQISTENKLAAVITAISVLSYTYFITISFVGFKPKYYMLFFGLLSIYFHKKSKYAMSGLFSSFSAAFWQTGVIIPIVLFSTLYMDSDSSISSIKLKKFISGCLISFAIVVLPFIFIGSGYNIFEQVILSSIITRNESSLLIKSAKAVLFYGYSNYIILIGITSSILFLKLRKEMWLSAIIGFFTFQILFLDFESHPDLIPLFIFSSIAVGIIYSLIEDKENHSINISERNTNILVSILLVVFIINSIFYGGFHIFAKKNPQMSGNTDNPIVIEKIKSFTGVSIENSAGSPDDIPYKYSREYMKTIFWEQIQPEYCHYRVGGMHAKWIELRDINISDERC